MSVNDIYLELGWFHLLLRNVNKNTLLWFEGGVKMHPWKKTCLNPKRTVANLYGVRDDGSQGFQQDC